MPAKVAVAVFLGWSGPRSKAVAKALANWLPQVIQAVSPWLSESMDRGAQWFATIGVHLKGADYGLMCVTPENATEPWVLFEAGALAIHTSERLACPYLLDLTPAQLSGPLGQLQAATADRDGTWQVVQTINKLLDEPVRLSDDRLRRAFDRWWPELEGQLAAARQIVAAPPPAPQRSPEDKLDEILETVRAIQRAETRVFNTTASLPLTGSPIETAYGITTPTAQLGHAFLAGMGIRPIGGPITTAEISKWRSSLKGLLADADALQAAVHPPPAEPVAEPARPVRTVRARVKKTSKPPPKREP